MDLMGDYAGSELFVIDGAFPHSIPCEPGRSNCSSIAGDSLLQLVLDDPLLALGRPDGMCAA